MLISELVSFGRVEDESLVVHSKKNVVLKLDRQGSEIFGLIYKGYSKKEIIAYFQGLYPMVGEQIEKDVNNFIDILKKKDIIVE